MSDRVSFSEEWHKRGREAYLNNHVFEGYIYLWLSLTIAAKQHAANNKRISKNETETRDLFQIQDWAGGCSNEILKRLKNHHEDMCELCERESENGDPIITIKSNTGNASAIEQHHKNFIKYWRNHQSSNESPTYIVRSFIEILNRVRNNLFHGEKYFEIESDSKLLGLLCPSLDKIAELSIKQLHE